MKLYSNVLPYNTIHESETNSFCHYSNLFLVGNYNVRDFLSFISSIAVSVVQYVHVGIDKLTTNENVLYILPSIVLLFGHLEM